MTTASQTMIGRIAGHRSQTLAFRVAIISLVLIGISSIMRSWPPPALADDTKEVQ